MTREEAIKYLQDIGMRFVPTDQYGDYDDPKPYDDAIDLAIEALSAVCDDCIWHVCNYNKVDWDASSAEAEWIFEPKDAIELMFAKPKCSECGFESADGGNFYSNCRARMKGEEHDD